MNRSVQIGQKKDICHLLERDEGQLEEQGDRRVSKGGHHLRTAPGTRHHQGRETHVGEGRECEFTTEDCGLRIHKWENDRGEE